jgi:hypothetical protein
MHNTQKSKHTAPQTVHFCSLASFSRVQIEQFHLPLINDSVRKEQDRAAKYRVVTYAFCFGGSGFLAGAAAALASGCLDGAAAAEPAAAAPEVFLSSTFLGGAAPD